MNVVSLYRAIDQVGQVIDVLVSNKRDPAHLSMGKSGQNIVYERLLLSGDRLHPG